LQGPTPSFVVSTIWQKLSLGEIKKLYIQEIQKIEVFIPNYLCYATHFVKPHILWNNYNDCHEKAMLQKVTMEQRPTWIIIPKVDPKKGN
jgi:hypothetical protein